MIVKAVAGSKAVNECASVVPELIGPELLISTSYRSIGCPFVFGSVHVTSTDVLVVALHTGALGTSGSVSDVVQKT